MRRALLRDLLDEAVASLVSRPGRVVLTVAGPALGVAALVATLGLAATAGNHIVGRFDALAATEVVVSVRQGEPGAVVGGPGSSGGGAGEAGAPSGEAAVPWDAGTRLARLNGVRAAGTLSELPVDSRRVRAVDGAADRSATTVSLYAASPGLFDAVHGELAHGRWFDAGHDQRGDQVAVVGQSLADQLQLGSLARRPAVLVGDRVYTVVGVLDRVARVPELLNAVIVTDAEGRAAHGLTSPAEVHVDTDIGAARVVARQAPHALVPTAPGAFEVRVPPEPASTRAQVDEDTQALFLLLGVLSLVVGGLGIANTTFVAVLERRAEIGLRRSLGARRSAVAVQFLLESTGIGLLGGMVGAATGTIIVVAVAATKGWTPVLAPWLPFAGAGFGLVLGFVAGLYPSMRAARLEPMEVLRGD